MSLLSELFVSAHQGAPTTAYTYPYGRLERKDSLDAKSEIKLPGTTRLRKLPVLIRKRDPDLDDFQQIDVTPHRLIMVIRGRLERANWASDDSGKFCILKLA